MLSYKEILDAAGIVIYCALGLMAVYGLFCVILLLRRIRQKQFRSNAAADRFLGEIREHLDRRNLDNITETCDSPPFWSKAVPQLILVAIQRKNLPPQKLRRILAEKFERDVLSDLEYRMSWISTVVKSAPMLGLLGTVVGMIRAFDDIRVTQRLGGEAGDLAGSISVALYTTAIGLAVAIPLVLAGAMINVRIGRLQDGVQQWLGMFLDDFETLRAAGEDR